MAVKRGGDPASVVMFVIYLLILATTCLGGIWWVFLSPVDPR